MYRKLVSLGFKEVLQSVPLLNSVLHDKWSSSELFLA